jgi:hypothetical protein
MTTFPLYQGLSDDFDRHEGTLRPYVRSDNTAVTLEKHYDLRMFHTTNQTVPWTLNDYTWWTGFRYQTFGLGQIGNQRSINNVQTRGRTQTEIDALNQTTLDSMTQFQIENVQTTNGNEEWPSGDSNVVVGKDATYRYSNTIRVTLPATGVLKTVNSYYTDDISTDFGEAGVTYFLELTLRNFPAQAAGAHLDLANSYIDVSSDVNFSAQYTDSFKFSDSVNSLTAGGDTFARWPRSTILHADPSKLKAVRFRLQSAGTGSMTFIAQAMRIVPAGWPNSIIGEDTKRQTLARQIPRAGGTESSTLFGDMFFYQTRPKNVTTYTFFNSGHLPATGTDDNTIRQYYRYDPTTGNRIEVRITSRSTQTRLFIDHKIAGVTTNLVSTGTNTNILNAETDYVLVTTTNGTSVTATVYLANGLSLGSQVGTLTGTGTTTITSRGYVGMSFEPYNYDFYITQFSTNVADFGSFISTNFLSRTPVKGVTLYPRTSPTENMLDGGAFEEFGDADATTTDNNTYTIVRTNSANQGGVRYNTPVYIGNSGQVVISGAIQPVGAVHGTYRIGLIDENDSVAWIYNLSGLLPNQYNTFSLLLPPGLFPQQYYLHIQQSGSFADTFRVRDLTMAHNTVGWEASIDAGTTWQPFFGALDYRWSVLKFGTSGTSLKLRATALSDHAYISGYNLVPRYVA